MARGSKRHVDLTESQLECHIDPLVFRAPCENSGSSTERSATQTRTMTIFIEKLVHAPLKSTATTVLSLGFILATRAGAIDDHIASRCNEVTVVLLRTRHAKTFVWCEQRSLHLVHGS